MINEKQTPSVLTHLSLCSGYDGIGIALGRIFPGLRNLAHVEIETFPIANLVSSMEAGEMDPCPVFTDLKRFPFHEVAGKVSILSAGFPCQPFSQAGLQKGVDDPRHLYPFIADGITACRPEVVFLENVEGIISSKTSDGESVLLYVLRDLEERGYECAWGVFSAAEVGAPHQRKRVFILGVADSSEFIDRGESGNSGKTDGPIREGGEGDRRGKEPPRGSDAIGESELGNSAKLDGEQPNGEADQVGGSCDEDRGSSHVRGELADPGSEGSQGRGQLGEQKTGWNTQEKIGYDFARCHTQWPARPGQPQHDWEEPRTVGNPTNPIGRPGQHGGEEPSERSHGNDESPRPGSGSGELADPGCGGSGNGRASGGIENEGRQVAEAGGEALRSGKETPLAGDAGQGGQNMADAGSAGRDDLWSEAEGCGGRGGQEELGNPDGAQRLTGRSLPREEGGATGRPDVNGPSKEGEELADPPRLERESGPGRRGICQSSLPPGQQEELANTHGGGGEKPGLQQPSLSPESGEEGTERQAQPELGRATDAWGGLCGVDAVTNRVDRLRLLGNGVVPATAERAFRILAEELLS